MTQGGLVCRTLCALSDRKLSTAQPRYKGGGKLYHLGCRRPGKRSWLTGQQKCHIHRMENVTLNPKEQARLQVLNSLRDEHMTLDQAATLMGV